MFWWRTERTATSAPRSTPTAAISETRCSRRSTAICAVFRQRFSPPGSANLGVMTIDQAKSFVQKHGVVLVSGKGPVPRLTEAIASEPISGSWWGHPKAHEIFAVLQAVVESGDVLVCRLVEGKVSLV